MKEGKERSNTKPETKTPKPKIAPAPQATKPKSDFGVFTYSVFDKDGPSYVHWAEGLNMVIRKDGVKIELNSEEIQKVVKALPRTLGGTYN